MAPTHHGRGDAAGAPAEGVGDALVLASPTVATDTSPRGERGLTRRRYGVPADACRGASIVTWCQWPWSGLSDHPKAAASRLAMTTVTPIPPPAFA